MRVLPYFQGVQVNHARNVRKNNNPETTPRQADAAEPAGRAAPPSTDQFIPTSPVTGVVYSIKTGEGKNENTGGVVKSGSYSFYKLDGYLRQEENASGRGGKLDIKG